MTINTNELSPAIAQFIIKLNNELSRKSNIELEKVLKDKNNDIKKEANQALNLKKERLNEH